MARSFVYRCLAICGAALLKVCVAYHDAYLSIIMAIGFSHYATSVFYARRRFGLLLQSPSNAAALVALVVAGVALAAMDVVPDAVKLLYYFGIHHTFNETFMSAQVVHHADVRETWCYRASSGMANWVLYVAMLSGAEFSSVNRPVLIAAVVVAGVSFAWFALRVLRSASWRSRIDAISAECLGLILAVACLAGVLRIEFMDVVLYHFLFWSLYPIDKLASRSTHAALRFVAANAVLSVATLVASPVGWLSYALVGSPFMSAFYALSYFHITSSFAVSDQHPAWIVRWFKQPAPAA